MRSGQSARCLCYLTLLLAAAPGCQALHSYRPVPIEVRDADTKKPIEGAEVRISYPLSNSSFAPWESLGTCGADGIAHLQAAPYGDAGVMLDVTAKGYMNEQKFLTVQEVQSFQKAHFFEDVSLRPAAYHVELYVEPRPTIELVVPVGFQGMMKARIVIREDATSPPGQRHFSYPMPASKELVITGPPLIRHVVPTDLRVKFADDTPISRRAQDTLLGYWWIKSEADYNYLLVGTQKDLDHYRRSLMNRHMVDRGEKAHAEQGSRQPPRALSAGESLSPASQISTPGFFDRSAMDASTPFGYNPSRAR